MEKCFTHVEDSVILESLHQALLTSPGHHTGTSWISGSMRHQHWQRPLSI